MVLNGDLGLLFDIKFGEAQSAFVFYAQLLVQRSQIMAVAAPFGPEVYYDG
jgi:hypothetical protein